ncbi:MAG: hypothetical protein H7233_12060 [Pseudorhodobacter sp.]|nr:hypothetical protein [Frankiaceae bacterium]
MVFTSGTTGAPTGSRGSGHRFEAVLAFMESDGQMTDGTRPSAITAGTLGQVSIFPGPS